MRSAAATCARRGADVIDINMGCPVPKVCKTGAGAALLADPDTAVAVARAAREGTRPAGHGEAALRPARRATRSGVDARPPPGRGRGRRGDRLPSAPAPRPPQGHARLRPGRAAGRVAARAGDPLRRAARPPTPRRLRADRRRGGHAGARLARQPVAVRAAARYRDDEPSRRRGPRRARLADRPRVEHLGEARAGRWLRKAYPWYVERLGGGKALQGAMQQTDTVEAARAVLAGRFSLSAAA